MYDDIKQPCGFRTGGQDFIITNITFNLRMRLCWNNGG